MKEKWKSFLKNKNNLILLVLVGILLLVINLPVEKNSTKSKLSDSESDNISKQSAAEDDLQEYCSYLEEKLAKILSKLEGAGKVEVMISMKSSEEKIVEKDQSVSRSDTEETDSQGGNRKISSFDSRESTIYDSGSTSQPYVVKVLVPKVEGIIVIAQGAGTGNVSKNISDALQALFGIEAHKIKVVKMETQ